MMAWLLLLFPLLRYCIAFWSACVLLAIPLFCLYGVVHAALRYVTAFVG
jgi:hypothetical protein